MLLDCGNCVNALFDYDNCVNVLLDCGNCVNMLLNYGRLYVEETLSSDSNSCHNSSSTVARSQHVSSHVPQSEVFVVNKSSRESKHCILM